MENSTSTSTVKKTERERYTRLLLTKVDRSMKCPYKIVETGTATLSVGIVQIFEYTGVH